MIDYETLWQAMPNPSLVVGHDRRIREVNLSSESFLALSAKTLRGTDIVELAGSDSRLASLVDRALCDGETLSEYNVEFLWPEAPVRMVDIFAVPVDDDAILVQIHPRTNAEAMGRQLSSRDAARSVVGMASMLAHEIKNPLAGISGAAQLLEMNAQPDDAELTALIRSETERIGNLVSRVEQFGDIGVTKRVAVNIHDVLDRAARSARAGFASHVRFIEEYDPSLPQTLSDADQLMQVIMNLLKNAAEAVPPVGAVIMLKTSYQAGIRVRMSNGMTESLPLQIEISDNGSGVPDGVKDHIFEPFVTSKSSGSGLGLALVSKIVTDHGGVISCDSSPGFTIFRLRLPVAPEARGTLKNATNKEIPA